MGRLLIVGDVHWSTYSSIVRGRGKACSLRLERLIDSINWCEYLAKEKRCEGVVYLGDFFDKPELTSEEISMLERISWSELPHFFIVGNHESDVASLEYNSTNVMRKHGFSVISKPTTFGNIVMLPYITEDSRKPLKEYLGNLDRPIVFSHNDLKGIRYGMYESKAGFDVDEIESLTSMYVNGHLHNGAWVNGSHTILNLGNICGANFSEDARVYPHRAMVLDTDGLKYEFIENPHAMNFYKFDVSNESDFALLEGLKKHSVLSIKCACELKDKLKAIIEGNPNVMVYKMILYSKGGDAAGEAPNEGLGGMDYMDKFREFILSNLGNDSIVLEELKEVCGQ